LLFQILIILQATSLRSCIWHAVPSNVNAVMPRCSAAQQQFIQSLTTHKRRVASALTVTDGITLLGLSRYQRLPRSHIVALHSVSTTVTATSATYYHRAVVNGEMVHARNYSADFERNSYTVQLVELLTYMFSKLSYMAKMCIYVIIYGHI
jgi:hypothetical protein